MYVVRWWVAMALVAAHMQASHPMFPCLSFSFLELSFKEPQMAYGDFGYEVTSYSSFILLKHITVKIYSP